MGRKEFLRGALVGIDVAESLVNVTRCVACRLFIFWPEHPIHLDTLWNVEGGTTRILQLCEHVCTDECQPAWWVLRAASRKLTLQLLRSILRVVGDKVVAGFYVRLEGDSSIVRCRPRKNLSAKAGRTGVKKLHLDRDLRQCIGRGPAVNQSRSPPRRRRARPTARQQPPRRRRARPTALSAEDIIKGRLSRQSPWSIVRQRRDGAWPDVAAAAGPATGPAARPQFSGASFFDSTKAFAGAQREKVSLDAFDELLKWLSEEASEIAIFDASNVTMKRRALLQEKINAHSERCGIPPMSLVFIESICTDESVIREQMLFKVHHSPDFATMAEADALADLQQRIEHYEKIYDTVREEEGAYIKMFDLRAKASVCNIYGRMSKSVLPFLLALHWHPRPIFLYVLPRDAGAEPSAALGARHSALCEWAAAYPRKGELQILTSTEVRARCNAPVTKCGALHCATRCAHCTAPWHATACCTRRAPSPLPMCSPTRWAARRGPASGRCSHLSARPKARPPWPLCPSLAT